MNSFSNRINAWLISASRSPSVFVVECLNVVLLELRPYRAPSTLPAGEFSLRPGWCALLPADSQSSQRNHRRHDRCERNGKNRESMASALTCEMIPRRERKDFVRGLADGQNCRAH